MALFRGTVMASTKITAQPNPKAASTFLEQPRNVHMPRKKARAIFSMKAEVVKILR
jgi:hypothetical protein